MLNIANIHTFILHSFLFCITYFGLFASKETSIDLENFLLPFEWNVCSAVPFIYVQNTIIKLNWNRLFCHVLTLILVVLYLIKTNTREPHSKSQKIKLKKRHFFRGPVTSHPGTSHPIQFSDDYCRSRVKCVVLIEPVWWRHSQPGSLGNGRVLRIEKISILFFECFRISVLLHHFALKKNVELFFSCRRFKTTGNWATQIPVFGFT